MHETNKKVLLEKWKSKGFLGVCANTNKLVGSWANLSLLVFWLNYMEQSFLENGKFKKTIKKIKMLVGTYIK